MRREPQGQAGSKGRVREQREEESEGPGEQDLNIKTFKFRC